MDVKQQYTEYVYPNYQEQWDTNAPNYVNSINFSINLPMINHYLYNGKKYNYDNYRVLVAGTGLSSDLIHMALQLKNFNNTHVLGIDVSKTALNISKERVKKYNLDNVSFEELSLLDLDEKIHGKFDLIICVGVLHHLKNPSDGLNSLKQVLKEDGGINIMVYGKYGRAGIYQMQDLMKKINFNKNKLSDQVENFKNVYQQLPTTNWFSHSDNWVCDHKTFGDEGIVDLVLHCQDRAYTIPELYEWVNNSGLNIIDFCENKEKLNYQIENCDYPDNIVDKYTINELYFGNLIKHNFFVSNKVNISATIDNLENIMILELILFKTIEEIVNYINTTNEEKTVVTIPLNYDQIDFKKMCRKQNENYIYSFHSRGVVLEKNPINMSILSRINNERTTREIFELVRNELNLTETNEELLEIFRPVYEQFNNHNMILLRN